MRHVLDIRGRRKWPVAVLTALAGGLLVSAALAATIVGTAGNDVLRGTAKADRLMGKGGNDRLYELAGNDVLQGGRGPTGTSAAPVAIPSWLHRESTSRRTARS